MNIPIYSEAVADVAVGNSQRFEGRRTESHERELESIIPNRMWFRLREACELKGLSYKTACNRTGLQPNGGRPDGRVGGRKCWKRETIVAWIQQTDQDIQTERGQL